MEENTPKTGKYALNYGLILGAAGLIFGIMLYSMNMHYERGAAIQTVQIGMTAIVIFIAVYQYKKANSNFLKLNEALKIGTGTAIISAIIGLIYFLVLSNFIEPDFMDKMFEIGRNEMIENNPEMTDEQINQMGEMQKKFAWVSYPVILIFNTLLGLVFGLISGLILKKQKPTY